MSIVDAPADEPGSDWEARTGRPYVFIGGCPARLSAGYLLAKAGRRVIVFEGEDPVGGLAETVVDPNVPTA